MSATKDTTALALLELPDLSTPEAVADFWARARAMKAQIDDMDAELATFEASGLLVEYQDRLTAETREALMRLALALFLRMPSSVANLRAALEGMPKLEVRG